MNAPLRVGDEVYFVQHNKFSGTELTREFIRENITDVEVGCIKLAVSSFASSDEPAVIFYTIRKQGDHNDYGRWDYEVIPTLDSNFIDELVEL